MKKALAAAALFLALALCLTAALAAGGDASDPLISLSYLEGLFSQSVDASLGSSLDLSDDTVRSHIRRQLDSMESSAEAVAGQNYASTAEEATLKEGDVLTGATGLVVIPLGGEVRLSLTAGAVVDATDGCEVLSGTSLTSRHRYVVAEESLAHFTVASPAAVLSYQGGYAFSLSGDGPDYYAVARALRDLDLFRGTGSGIGEGFDLHLAPTRAEGLVMFIRILGEEADALACSYTHPFTDVPGWMDRYVAWAYHMGYTNGVSPTQFGPSLPVSAAEYQEFLLRALGYSVAGVQDYTTSLDRAREHGALTDGEYDMLQNGPFLRAHVAYVSYYALDMVLSGSQQTLAQRLESAGLFTAYQLSAARSQVNFPRIA